MDVVHLRIPFQFVRDLTRVSWRDVRFGLLNELLDPAAPIELAADQIGEFAEHSAVLLQLQEPARTNRRWSSLNSSPQMRPQLPRTRSAPSWLYLVLAWLYQHRDEYPDPLQRVEEVYAHFGYPEQIAKFVRYMPMAGPGLGSLEANERRLFERWKRYLDEAAPAYAP